LQEKHICLTILETLIFFRKIPLFVIESFFHGIYICNMDSGIMN